MGNPLTREKHYREYTIWKCKTVRVIDFKRVKNAVSSMTPLPFLGRLIDTAHPIPQGTSTGKIPLRDIGWATIRVSSLDRIKGDSLCLKGQSTRRRCGRWDFRAGASSQWEIRAASQRGGEEEDREGNPERE